MAVKWMKKNDIRFFIVNFAAYYALMRNGDRHRTDGTPPYRPGKRLNRMQGMSLYNKVKEYEYT